MNEAHKAEWRMGVGHILANIVDDISKSIWNDQKMKSVIDDAQSELNHLIAFEKQTSYTEGLAAGQEAAIRVFAMIHALTTRSQEDEDLIDNIVNCGHTIDPEAVVKAAAELRDSQEAEEGRNTTN